jgi:hypothetical protein
LARRRVEERNNENMTSHPLTVPRLDALTPTPRWPWVRDFGVVGGCTGFLAPFPVLRDLEYSALTALGGAASGLLLGLVSASVLADGPRRWHKALLPLLGMALGAMWGIAAALPTLFSPMRQMFGLSVMSAAAAGALQLGWFWPAYRHRRINRRSTWPTVLLATVLGGGLGYSELWVVLLLLEPR